MAIVIPFADHIMTNTARRSRVVRRHKHSGPATVWIFPFQLRRLPKPPDADPGTESPTETVQSMRWRFASPRRGNG